MSLHISALIEKGSDIAPRSLGKEEETRTQKPFAGTLRVTNPARQSLASSRKRVLRGGRRLPLRSVDSQCLGRAIEPRKHIAGVLALVSRGDHVGTPQWPGVPDPAGVVEQGQGTPGVPRNVGAPSVSTDMPGSGTGTPTPRSPRPCVRPMGANTTQGWYRQAKATKCGERDGRESERLIVLLIPGNHSEGPGVGKETPCHETVGVKHGGCIETRGRVHETRTDRRTRSTKSGDGIYLSGLLH